MDHDDELTPSTLQDAVDVFTEHPEVGFVYMDFANVHENGSNYSYGDFTSKGYAGYYREKYNGKWIDVYMTPNVNNITLSHIVCLPNHPRIWRKSVLDQIGNYSEFLPICDDQELLLRTALETKIAKIPKLGYIQYMNANNNNFSLLRNREINRLGPDYIVPMFYSTYKVHEKMKIFDAYEDESYIHTNVQLWKRPADFIHKFCNLRIRKEYKRQYCILGIETFQKHRSTIEEAYKDPTNDFLVLDGSGNKDALCFFLDTLHYSRMKCYSLEHASKEELIKYFHLLYKSCPTTIVLE